MFTDRDQTLSVTSFKQTQKHFEQMKSFLEEGNFIVVITTGNHESTLFHENKRLETLWKSLSEYKNQIIGLPPFCAGVTLGNIKIPIGHNAIYKRNIIGPILRMFLENRYEIDQIFCIGDSPIDMDMIIDAVSKFDAIGYHIRKDDSYFAKDRGIDFFDERDWIYLRNHGVDSFATFMNQYVLPSKEKQKRKEVHEISYRKK